MTGHWIIGGYMYVICQLDLSCHEKNSHTFLYICHACKQMYTNEHVHCSYDMHAKRYICQQYVPSELP